jgi:hypothetical protein
MRGWVGLLFLCVCGTHHTEIRSRDLVQIYEAILLDSEGAVTTGLLKAVRYAKDNRLLPRGFDKTTAPPDAAVHGDALADADFVGGTRPGCPLRCHSALTAQVRFPLHCRIKRRK